MDVNKMKSLSLKKIKMKIFPYWCQLTFPSADLWKELKNQKSRILNQKGFASIEAVVLVVLFFSMLYYSFGFFGVVHTGIIHNIHSRTYAFETFRHRTNLMYFRSNRLGEVNKMSHYFNRSSRLHGINTEGGGTKQIATERSISMGLSLEEEGRDQNTHNRDIYERIPAYDRNQTVGVNPVWILTMYGICFNSQCGGD